MKYKGYTGRVEYDADDRVFHGRVNDISDVVTFQGDSVDELEAAFRRSVDEYIAFCEEQGLEPQRRFSGRFVLRLPPATHRQVADAVTRKGESMNSWIVKAIEQQLHLR